MSLKTSKIQSTPFPYSSFKFIKIQSTPFPYSSFKFIKVKKQNQESKPVLPTRNLALRCSS